MNLLDAIDLVEEQNAIASRMNSATTFLNRVINSTAFDNSVLKKESSANNMMTP
jgi:hypothetical protein